MLWLSVEVGEPWCVSKKGLADGVGRIQLRDGGPDV